MLNKLDKEKLSSDLIPLANVDFVKVTIKESDQFVGYLQARLWYWAADCTSASIVWRTSCSGKGQLSLRALFVGPFQD